MSILIQWATIAGVLVTLGVNLFGIVHVVAIVRQDNRDWKSRLALMDKEWGDRFSIAERRLDSLERMRDTLTTQSSALSVKMDDQTAEIKRMRDRLDRFLDTSAPPRVV